MIESPEARVDAPPQTDLQTEFDQPMGAGALVEAAVVDHRSSSDAKVALFRSPFRGRTDVYRRPCCFVAADFGKAGEPSAANLRQDRRSVGLDNYMLHR